MKNGRRMGFLKGEGRVSGEIRGRRAKQGEDGRR
jgi:hypothetical protein